MINLQVGTPLNITIPQVYKYMNVEYIDNFFNNGILRIGSFGYYRKFPDEIRGDKNEGSGVLQSKSQDDGFTYFLMNQQGTNSYMFCTSTIDSEDLKANFDTNSHFRINKPLDFAAAISRALSGVNHISLGICNYQDYRIINKTISGLSVNDFTNEKGEIIIGGPKMNTRTNQLRENGIDLMYLKEKKYQFQNEFRFVWSLDMNYYKVKDIIDIECKEAIKYCERIDVMQ